MAPIKSKVSCCSGVAFRVHILQVILFNVLNNLKNSTNANYVMMVSEIHDWAQNWYFLTAAIKS
jgi:hypothetical protein